MTSFRTPDVRGIYMWKSMIPKRSKTVKSKPEHQTTMLPIPFWKKTQFRNITSLMSVERFELCFRVPKMKFGFHPTSLYL
jgi:hypothetical protein